MLLSALLVPTFHAANFPGWPDRYACAALRPGLHPSFVSGRGWRGGLARRISGPSSTPCWRGEKACHGRCNSSPVLRFFIDLFPPTLAEGVELRAAICFRYSPFRLDPAALLQSQK